MMSEITKIQPFYGFSASQNRKIGGPGELGKEDFLYLLVTQLRYQDPMEPVESYEFVAQLAQFSSLEQLRNIGKGVEMALNMQRGSFSILAAQLIGKEVKVENYTLSWNGEPLQIQYELSADAEDVIVNIYDAVGGLRRTIRVGAQNKGENRVEWDGKDDSGKSLEKGEYSFEVLALNKDRELIGAKGFIKGKVTGVKLDENSVLLTLEGVDVPLSNLISIEN